VKNRLFQDHLNDWGVAYAHRSYGSTHTRARDIRNIYEVSAPVPGETPAPEANNFLDIVRNLFREACEVAGARVVG